MLNSVLNLIQVCGKYNITIDISETDTSYPSELPKNEYIVKFYKQNNPENIIIDMGGAVLKFFSVQELYNKQTGYRWSAFSEGREVLPSWDFNSIVIADDIGGGKPIIAKFKEKSMPIFASYDGVEKFIVSQSLEQFLDSITVLIDIIYGKYKIYEMYNEDEEIIEEFKNDFDNELSSILNKECIKNLFNYFYG